MPEIFTAYDASDPQKVFIEIDGRQLLKEFESDIDLQIDLFEAGLSHSEIATVMRDIELSRNHVSLGERHPMERMPVFVGHPYSPPAPYIPPASPCRLARLESRQRVYGHAFFFVCGVVAALISRGW